MKKRSNRSVKYCVKEKLLDFSNTKYNYCRSSCSYKFLVSIVYATGIMDVIGSCCLMYSCSVMLETLQEMEVFNKQFPKSMAGMSKIVSYMVNIVSEEGGLDIDVQDYEETLIWVVMAMKISVVLLLGVALFFLILSTLLFIGIYKKHSTCCFIWNVCLCMTMIIYFGLAVIVSVFKLFDLTTPQVMMVGAYGFYRFATIIAVYRFQQKFLFISKVNEINAWFDHYD